MLTAALPLITAETQRVPLVVAKAKQEDGLEEGDILKACDFAERENLVPALQAARLRRRIEELA